MATISIGYDSAGDVELILQESTDIDTKKLGNYNLGPSNVKVKQVHLRVSCEKLISSSQCFRAMLEDSKFREGSELKKQGHIEIELLEPEDEPQPLMLIIGTLYHENTTAPTSISLSMLYQVAILVDKFQWHDLMGPMSASWFMALVQPKFPDAFSTEVVQYLWIAWVFGLEACFKKLTRLAMQDNRNPIDWKKENTRLPERVIDSINQQRQMAFGCIEATLRKFRGHILLPGTIFHNPEQRQDRTMRGLILGCVELSCQDLRLGDFARKDHAGLSIRSVKSSISALESLDGWAVDTCSSGYRRHFMSIEFWDLKIRLQKTITELKMEKWGLEYI
ncbi:hypothetical protein EJ08DRAFT_645232 [Tothia fuscella]|uniref:BTB domain-containing protein n=1 Tax=Tothia fuscella TaxID=1048955 RepID=A0A9P4P414_9PEZI|nr:hypothetical protein EJ08DRAFT_645232 [Tothia fuscella]